MHIISVRTAAAWALVSQYTSFTLQFITSLVLARWFITPEELGLFSIAFAAITLVAFLQDFGVTRYITGERDLSLEKLQMAFTVSVCFAWGIALLSILSAWPISWFYGDPRMLPVTLVISTSYIFVPLAIVPQAMCQRRLDYKSNAMIEMGAALANMIAALGLAIGGHGALALAWGAFAQQAARLVISQWRSRGMWPWPLRLHDAQPILAIGGTNSMQAVCNSVIARAPELMIGHLIGNVAVGLFARASGLALQLRLLVSGAVTGVFYPAFRQVRDRGEPLGAPYLRVVAAYTGISWPALAGIATLAQPLVMTLYGQRWMEAAPLLIWLALAQLCYVALPLHADLPILLGRMPAMIRRLLVDTLASILLLALAAPFGIEWVAISRLVHGLVWIMIYAPFMRAILNFSWRDLMRIYAKSFIATLAAIVPLLMSYGLWHGPHDAGLMQALGGAMAGIGCWLVTLYALRHPLFTEIALMLGDLRQALSTPRRTRAQP
ncbi:oligosaccharide flippase family protein [Aquisediminimonas sediminicola]|uniref:oligosaccharide flippase family protein n=1 Tax=Alteraquisediminimonas sediminicola TaxID=2676787 RepID=UPI001C8EACA9|nr:oligosaccharide flippase family protein [Aquisediminimonas sediminicola]